MQPLEAGKTGASAPRCALSRGAAQFGQRIVASIDSGDPGAAQTLAASSKVEIAILVPYAFDIVFEMDDIIDFSSYEVGMELLKKYDIEIN